MTVAKYLQNDVYGNPVNYPRANAAVNPDAQVSFLHKHFGTSDLAVLINILILLIILTVIFRLILEITYFTRAPEQQMVSLELTPPLFRDQSLASSEQMFLMLGGLNSRLNLKDRLLKRKRIISLEIVADKTDGIRFIAQVPFAELDSTKKILRAHMPEIKIKQIDDYMSLATENQSVEILDFKLTGHFSQPLKTSFSFKDDDPMTYLTATMTDLEPDEIIAYQISLYPANLFQARRVKRLSSKQVSDKTGSTWFIHYFILAYRVAFYLFGLGRDLVAYFSSGSMTGSNKSAKPYFTKPNPQDNLFMAPKYTQPLFQVNIRTLVSSRIKINRLNKLMALSSCLSLYSLNSQQSLLAATKQSKRFSYWKYNNRLLSIIPSNRSLLSANELAGLYHFPSSKSLTAEGLKRSPNLSLPLPLELVNKPDHKSGMLIGNNVHHDLVQPIVINQAERQRHVFVVGGTGNGKTTLLLSAIVQDIKNGKGVAVVDPHGDLAELVINNLPEDRLKDVVYLNPNDLDYPIGINLLEINKELMGSQLAQEKDLVTEAAISVLRKTFSGDDSGGHRIEYVLRNAIHTALSVDGATIFTILKLLTDAHYRFSVVDKLEDDDLKNFWREEMGKAGAMQRVKMSAGVTAKIGRFKRSVSAERMLGQSKSTISFDDIMNHQKILICNLAKGKIGEDTSNLIGTTILAKLQLAALKRQAIASDKRKPFYLYVDEFQDFSTMPFLQMLSEARKYKLFLVMAEQSIAQQDDPRLTQILLDNVGTVICFRIRSDSEKLLLPLFKPYLGAGELASLPAYYFYVRIAGLESFRPFSGQTVIVESNPNTDLTKQIIRNSRSLYASRYVETVKTKLDLETKPGVHKVPNYRYY
jgi:hypothetical protein